MIITLGKESAVHPQEFYQKDNFIYLPIQKNASSWGRDFFTNIKWNKISCSNKENYSSDRENYEQSLVGKNIIIFLREPINRWYSAVAQYFYLQEYTTKNQEYLLDKKLLDLICSAVRLDNHSDLQIKWLLGLDLSKCTFFNINDELFEYNLHRFLHNKKLITTLEPLAKFKPSHTTDNDILKTSIITQLHNHIQNNPHKLKLISHFYITDLAFFNWLQLNRLFYKIENLPMTGAMHVSNKFKQAAKR